MSAATPTQVALYHPDHPGLYGETCRCCTGKGHQEVRVAGRTYLITCTACEGGGTVTAIVIRGAA